MNEHRDDAIDRLLTALQASSRTASSSACLEPDVLAAWIDNSLSGVERSRAESHAASCARCQALLAAMARASDGTAGSRPAEAPRLRLFRFAPWMAALGGAAAAALIWVAILPKADIEVGSPRQAPVEQAADARLEAAKQPAAAPVAPARTIDETRRANADAKPQNPAAAGAAALSRSDPTSTATGAAAARAQNERARVQAKDIQSTTPRPLPAVPGAPLPGAATIPPPSEVAAAPAPPVAPIPPRAADAAERAPQQQRAVGFRDMAVKEEAVMVQPALVIPSPDAKSLWRILNRRVVQHSTDGGTTWSAQAVDTNSPLNAGSAPSTRVCWIVGSQGTVLVTVDGRTWQRVPFPEPLDLVRVTATSADAALVIAADGRSFSTIDKGLTWR